MVIMENNLLFTIFVGGFVGAAAAYLGSFMVLKRMSLVGDALSHVALPGMAIALTMGISPILGALVALTIAILGIWYLEEHSSIYPEALVGVFFTASLAIGVLVTPEPELLEALFGNIENISTLEGFFAILLSVLIVIATKLISKKLTLAIVSEDLAKATGVQVRVINLFYLLLVGVVVALGVRFVGTLLMGALVVVPAVSARNIASGFRGYNMLAVFVGIFSALVGIFVSNVYSFSPGPIIVLVSILVFILSYLIKVFFKN